MNKSALVNLVFDPHAIYKGDGQRLVNLDQEIVAFQTICQLLSHSKDLVTKLGKIYILDRVFWKHFNSLRFIKGVNVVEYLPRREVRKIIGVDPPEWLTDENIVLWGLLDRVFYPSYNQQNLDATISFWLYPLIGDATTLGEFFSCAVSEENIPEPVLIPQIIEWLISRFHSLAIQAMPEYKVTEFISVLRADAAPKTFAFEWMRRQALLPLTRPMAGRALTLPGLPSESALNLELAKYIPFVFPLPQQLQTEVSNLFCRAVRSAKTEKPNTFEIVVLQLNALWDGIAIELDSWLKIDPRGLTDQAALHLSKLPGYENDKLIKKVVRSYRALGPIAPWPGLDESFMEWVSEYASYMESQFFRYMLPQIENDPAQHFAKWIMKNPGVIFNNPDRSYLGISERIRKALKQGRSVIVVMIDALAMHVVSLALEAFGKKLGEAPTDLKYVFSPIPTITEVCKEAILGGALPRDCSGNLEKTILLRYELNNEQLQLASHWDSPGRVLVKAETRLLVYRDNRLDSQLGTFANYRELRESFESIAASVASLVGRWAEEFKHWQKTLPLIILTGDHGFTFSPKSTNNHIKSPKEHHRCISIGSNKHDKLDPKTNWLFHLDRNDWFLHESYLVSPGRMFGLDTMSGWTLSHGGLLPEEVIIPVVEWFGEPQAALFPDVSIKPGVIREQGQWVIMLGMKNNFQVPTAGVKIWIAVAGEIKKFAERFPKLEPNCLHEFLVKIPGPDSISNDWVNFELDICLIDSQNPNTQTKNQSIRVERAKQFTEKTTGQIDFEGMF